MASKIATTGDEALDSILSGTPIQPTHDDLSPTGDPAADEAIRSIHANASKPKPVSPLDDVERKARGAWETTANLATSSVGALGGGLTYLGTLAATGDPDAAEAVKNDTQEALTYHPSTKNGKEWSTTANEAMSYLGQKPGQYLGGKTMDITGSPGAAATVETLANIPQFLLGAKGLKGKAGEIKPNVAEPLAANAATHGPSAGAAGAALDLEGLTPETAAEVQSSAQRGPINQEALARHKEAESLPMPEGETPLRLSKGQAMQDPQIRSDERNMRADKEAGSDLVQHEAEQNRKLVASESEIRARAVPDVLQRNNREHGQAAIDEIKQKDNELVLDTRAKYKALADKNGGDMPMDKGEAARAADSDLKKGYLADLANSHPVLKPILESLRSDEPMTFENWEAATRALSEVQRNGSSEGTAAGIIRKQFENMPISEEAQGLHGLLNEAKASAKKRFDLIDQNRSYKAVVNDNVPKDANGLHVIGAESPLADRFMDNHFLGASGSRAFVNRIKGVMADRPEFGKAIEGATLNDLRKAAGIDEYGQGGFNAATYRNRRMALDQKMDALVSPETAAHTQQLSNVAHYVANQPKGNFINNSASAIVAARMASQAEHAGGMSQALAKHLGGTVSNIATAGHPALAIVKGIGDTVMKQRAAEQAAAKDLAAQHAILEEKRNFIRESLKPGAGVGFEPPRIQQ
jgi:hypothetical protein